MESYKTYTNVKSLLKYELICLWYNNSGVKIWIEILVFFYENRLIYVAFQKQHSSPRFFGSRHVIGISNGVAVFLFFIQSLYPSEHDVHTTWDAQSCLDLLMDSQNITDTISEDFEWTYAVSFRCEGITYVAESVGMINTIWKNKIYWNL